MPRPNYPICLLTRVFMHGAIDVLLALLQPGATTESGAGVETQATKLAHIQNTRNIWFQHDLTRQTAEALLSGKGRDGKFVIRKSSMDGFYSLSVGTNGGTGFWHGLIRYNANATFDMQGRAPWNTLDDLVLTLTTELQDQNNKVQWFSHRS